MTQLSPGTNVALDVSGLDSYATVVLICDQSDLLVNRLSMVSKKNRRNSCDIAIKQ